MVLWDDVFKTVAKDFPDVQSSSLLIDAAAMDFVRKPESFDVVVASNLFGDILTDLRAIVSAGMLLDHLDLGRSADALRRAVATVLKAGKPRTPDLGGNATTTAVADAVVAAL